jgi:hypothetical protein
MPLGRAGGCGSGKVSLSHSPHRKDLLHEGRPAGASEHHNLASE